MSDEQQKPENPEAFPVPDRGNSGMMMRDYFAAKVMQASVGSPEILRCFREAEKDGRSVESHLAEYSYSIADAMLAERAKQ